MENLICCFSYKLDIERELCVFGDDLTNIAGLAASLWMEDGIMGGNDMVTFFAVFEEKFVFWGEVVNRTAFPDVCGHLVET